MVRRYEQPPGVCSTNVEFPAQIIGIHTDCTAGRTTVHLTLYAYLVGSPSLVDARWPVLDDWALELGDICQVRGYLADIDGHLGLVVVGLNLTP